MTIEVDTYYVDLARFKLNKALSELSKCQEYLRDANLNHNRNQIQKIINLTRKQLDALGDIPRNVELSDRPNN